MKVDELRRLYDAEPFRPLVIHTADGRRFPVRHREFLATAPSGRTVIVYQPDDSFDVIEVALVTSLKVKLNGAASRRTK
jgi:hypothetical protein